MVQELSSVTCARQSSFTLEGFIDNMEIDSISDYRILFPMDSVFNVKLGSNVILNVWIKNDGIGIQLCNNFPSINDFELLQEISKALVGLGVMDHQLYAWYPSQFLESILPFCDENILQYRDFGNGFIAVKYAPFFLKTGFSQRDISELPSSESIITFCEFCHFYDFCKV